MLCCVLQEPRQRLAIQGLAYPSKHSLFHEFDLNIQKPHFLLANKPFSVLLWNELPSLKVMLLPTQNQTDPTR